MIERFEDFTSNITQAYKYIIKIKAYEMRAFGLKAAHVMCLFFIGKHSEGLTASQLQKLCQEDKAGISKALAELKKQELIVANNDNGTKIYRAKYLITERGNKIYKEINNFIIHTVEECGKGLTEEERTVFYRSLSHITANLKSFYENLEENK